MHLELKEAELRERGGILDNVLETLFDCAIIIDKDGIILFNSRGSADLRRLDSESVIGKHFSEVNKTSSWPSVLSTGRAQMGIVDVIEGRKCVVNIFPIKDSGKVIGGVATVLFRNVSVLKQIISGLEQAVDSTNYFNILSRIGTSYTFNDYIGDSELVKKLIEQCKRASMSNKSVLIIGETGTGKEILASGIHAFNQQINGAPFIKINCSAIPNDLLESELFGYEKGAFTGANSTQKGKFELAAGGAILLDEIGDMPLSLQTKLLRVLEEHEFERVGGRKMIPLMAKVIASTNANLKNRLKEGTFRLDLYYRLSSFEIIVPPLRKRISDLPLIIENIVKRDELEIEFDDAALEEMAKYTWPGNVRELRNVLNRMDAIYFENFPITRSMVLETLYNDQDDELQSDENYKKEAVSINKVVEHQEGVPYHIKSDKEEFEKIIMQLKESNGNITETAKKLGVCRATLYKKIKKYNIIVN